MVNVLMCVFSVFLLTLFHFFLFCAFELGIRCDYVDAWHSGVWWLSLKCALLWSLIFILGRELKRGHRQVHVFPCTSQLLWIKTFSRNSAFLWVVWPLLSICHVVLFCVCLATGAHLERAVGHQRPSWQCLPQGARQEQQPSDHGSLWFQR